MPADLDADRREFERVGDQSSTQIPTGTVDQRPRAWSTYTVRTSAQYGSIPHQTMTCHTSHNPPWPTYHYTIVADHRKSFRCKHSISSQMARVSFVRSRPAAIESTIHSIITDAVALGEHHAIGALKAVRTYVRYLALTPEPPCMSITTEVFVETYRPCS